MDHPCESREPRVDHPRVSGENVVMSETETSDRLRPDRVQENVGAVNQTPQHIFRGTLLQIEHNGPLVSVEPHIKRRHAFDRFGPV